MAHASSAHTNLAPEHAPATKRNDIASRVASRDSILSNDLQSDVANVNNKVINTAK